MLRAVPCLSRCGGRFFSTSLASWQQQQRGGSPGSPAPSSSSSLLDEFTEGMPTLRSYNVSGMLDSTLDLGLSPTAGSSTRDAASKASANRAALLENTEIKELAMASRYGPRAGRTVSVHNNDTTSACRSLDSTLYANSIAQDRRAQRFYMKPGKRAEQKTALRHRKTFMKGFKHLMDIVQDAKRKGY